MKKLKNIAVLFAVCGLGLIATGCASILGGGSKKSVNFRSTPSNVHFTITDEKGVMVHEGQTPEMVTLKTGKAYGKKTYNIAFYQHGQLVREEVLKGHINGYYWGNIIFGGLIGMVIVDPATGAMFTLPSEFEVDLTGVSTTSEGETSSTGLKIVSRNEIPPHLQQQLVELE